METASSAAAPVTGAESNVVAFIIAVGVALAALLVFLILRKGRKMPGEHVFRASRLSRGNRLFPTQVAVTPQSVSRYTPEWFGRKEHSIHMAHVASVRIDTNLMFSDVVIESSGGTSTMVCHGHTKADAARMKNIIEQHQSAYYRTRP
jgi:LPXTG-motif cell wall-anchored protein